MPLRAPVNVVSLNDAVVVRLLGRFEILAVSHQVPRQLLGTLARLLGECYSMQVPEIAFLDAAVLRLPRSAASIDDVVQVLRAVGAVPPWFSDLLAR